MGDLPPTSRSDQPKIIGTLGRFIPRKGFADWIEALSILKARGIAFHAVLGGDGEERPYLERLMRKHDLADHLSFNGWVEDKEAFYTGLDLFVLPSHFEPFGLVLLEAIAYGVPIVSTEVEGPREIIQQGESGLLAAPRNPEALADAMQQMLADPARARLMAQAALAHARREYSPAAMAARLRDTLEKIAPLPAGTTSLYKDAA